MVEAKHHILTEAKKAGIRVAYPHVTSANATKVIEASYDILFTTPSRSYATLAPTKSLM